MNRDTLLADIPVVVLDLETTGLYPRTGDRVVEIGAVRYEGWKETGQFVELVYPERRMDPGATAVNGITDQMLAGKRPFRELMPELTEFIRGALVVAHNAAFDAGFLGIEYYIAAAPRLTNNWVCTLELAREKFDFDRNDLGAIASRLSLSTPTHAALSDVYATAELLQHMAGMFRRQGWGGDVGALFDWQGGEIFTSEPTRTYLVPDPIAKAIEKSRKLKISYGRDGNKTDRIIKPAYLSQNNSGTIYLIADCELRQDRRTFRLDRMTDIELI